MIKISDVVDKIIKQNSCLEFGMANRLLNLTQLAKFMQPIIESHLLREVKTSAIIMSLSRKQATVDKQMQAQKQFYIKNISIQSNLAVLSFDNTTKIQEKINTAYNVLHKQKEYFVFSESTTEISLMISNNQVETIKNIINTPPKYKNQTVSAISVKFDEESFKVPGLLAQLMQKLAFQNINIIEIASTFTEFIFFIDEKDVAITFETLHNCFSKKEN